MTLEDLGNLLADGVNALVRIAETLEELLSYVAEGHTKDEDHDA